MLRNPSQLDAPCNHGLEPQSAFSDRVDRACIALNEIQEGSQRRFKDVLQVFHVAAQPRTGLSAGGGAGFSEFDGFVAIGRVRPTDWQDSKACNSHS